MRKIGVAGVGLVLVAGMMLVSDAQNGLVPVESGVVSRDASLPYQATIELIYSEPMQLDGVQDAGNYVLGGLGKGTLTDNPTQVVGVDTQGTTFRLVWDAGEMLEGGDLTLEINGDAVTDLAGNPLDESSWLLLLEGSGLGDLPRIIGVSVRRN